MIVRVAVRVVKGLGAEDLRSDDERENERNAKSNANTAA
jgi:hypothetical protein